MSLCDVSLIRTISGLETSDVSDAELQDIRDKVATPELNRDLNIYVNDERVLFISEEKENDIDGSNTTFYAKGPHHRRRYIADNNDDGVVDETDITAYIIRDASPKDIRIENLNVTLEDRAIGRLDIKLNNGNPIPDEDDELYLSYAMAPVDVGEPSPAVSRACALLTASYAFTNIDAKKLESFKVGNVSVREQSDGAQTMYDQYKQVVSKLTQSEMVAAKQNENQIDNLDVFGW